MPTPIFIPTGKKTAEQLVQLTRNFCQEVDTTVYRDGFSDDPDTSGTSILGFINLAVENILETGYCKCYFDLTTADDTQEYGLVQDLNEIFDVRVVGEDKPLIPVTRLGEDVRDIGYQNITGPGRKGKPIKFYTIGDVIGFVPCPDAAYDITLFADSIPASLVNRTDYPARLPSRYHSILAIKAAIHICSSDAENPAAKERLPVLVSEYNERYERLEDLIRSRNEGVDDQIQVDDYRQRRWL